MASNAFDKDPKDDGASEESDIDMDNDNLNEDLTSADTTVETEKKSNDNDGKDDDDNNNEDENRLSKMKFAYRMQISMKDATDKQKMEHFVFRSILNDDLEDFEQLLKNGSVDLKQMDSLKWTPLMTAVQKRRTKIVEILIKENANIYKRDPVGFECLFFCFFVFF